jgi:uncharacterized protein (DUF1778 family)
MTAAAPATERLSRFDFRIESSRKRTIEHAAALMGMSLTQFAKTALIERAQEVVQQYQPTVLSDRDRDIFLAALESDEEPGAALRRAAKHYKTLRNRS